MGLTSTKPGQLASDFERLYEFAPVGVLLESAGEIVYANPAASRMLRARGGQILRQSFARFVHPDLWPGFARLLKQIGEGRLYGTRGETEFVPLGGTPFAAEFSAWAIADAEACAITFSQISEQKLQIRRFQTALDHSPVGVFELDMDLRYQWAYFVRSGMDTSTLIGKTDEHLLGPDQYKKVDAVRRAVLESGRGSRTDFSLMIGGNARSYDATIEPLHERNGKICGLSMVIIDITGRKAAEDALAEREANATRFIEVSPFGMAGRTMDGCIQFANDAFLNMVGVARNDLYDFANWERIVPPDHAEKETAVSAQVQEQGFVGPYQTEYLRSDGSRVPVLVSHAIFTSRNRKGVIAYCVDLTELKRAEARAVQLSQELETRNLELAGNNRELEEISRRKTQFLTSMSHELRTPLNGMIGFLDLLAEEKIGCLNERQRLYLARSRTSCQHLLKLVTDLLDLTRIEAGSVELSLENIAVARLLDEVLTVIEPMAAPKQLRIETDIPDDLWARVDRVRFSQIFYNLLTNAVKYTPAGGQVRIQAFLQEDVLYASVCDTGVGIDEEDRQAVFDHFYQSRPRDPQSGAGLGLAITRKLVELHGGTIGVTSKVGEGSCFFFTLPLL